jgi:hypothetical protein
MLNTYSKAFLLSNFVNLLNCDNGAINLGTLQSRIWSCDPFHVYFTDIWHAHGFSRDIHTPATESLFLLVFR